jgi:hypothetical protein
MRTWRAAAAGTAAATALALAGPAAPALAATPEHIMATFYAYPTDPGWRQVDGGAPTVRYSIVDICAPDGSGSGCNGHPADAKNPDWPPAIRALRAAGIVPLFYIWTGYGTVPLATVKSELSQGITWYGTHSPMFDGMSTTDPGYYKKLYNYAISVGATHVMFNPGTPPATAADGYFGAREILQVFEGSSRAFESATFPAWIRSHPPSQFSATLAAGTAATVGTDVTDAVTDGIGNFYENDEAEPPSYATLPSFWQQEIQDVAAGS